MNQKSVLKSLITFFLGIALFPLVAQTNEAPEITNISDDTPVTCENYTITFSVTDSTTGFKEVTLWYKEKGASDYTQTEVFNAQPDIPAEELPETDTFTVSVPVTSDTTLYYIEAMDNAGITGNLGDETSPVPVVTELQPVEETTKHMTIDFIYFRFKCEYVKSGDTIRAYYEKECGAYALGGSVVINENRYSTYQLTVYGDDSDTGKNGFEEGEPIHFEIVRDQTAYELTVNDVYFSDQDFTEYRGEQSYADVDVYNNYLIHDGDQTPSTLDGTDFGAVMDSKTNSYELYISGCIPDVSITGVTVEQDETENFTAEIIGSNLEVTYLAQDSDSATIILAVSDGTTYTFDVKGEVAPCAPPELRNTESNRVITNGDTSPWINDGTNFGRASEATTHNFKLVPTGVCSPPVTIENATSDSDEFTVSFTDTALDVTYLAIKTDTGTITLEMNDSSTYTFLVSGKNPCSSVSIEPGSFYESGSAEVTLQLDVEGTSNASVMAAKSGLQVQLDNRSGVTDEEYSFSIAPETLEPGEYSVLVMISNPHPDCPSVYMDSLTVEPDPVTGAFDSFSSCKWNMYPVPANDVLNIQGCDLQEVKSITFTSSSGRQYTKQQDRKTADQVNISDIPEGVYTVTLNTETGLSKKPGKIVICH